MDFRSDTELLLKQNLEIKKSRKNGRGTFCAFFAVMTAGKLTKAII